MIRLLQRWWRKVARWLGLTRSHTQQSDRAEVPSVEMKPLSDRAYETLYFSLLQRQEDAAPNEATAQVTAQLGKRANDANFVGWLRRFGKTLSKNPADNVALAQRMVALSGVELGELSRLSKEVGERLIAEAAVSSVEPQTTNSTLAENKAAEPDGAESSESEKLAKFYLQQGNDAYLRGDFGGAIAVYNQALDVNPNDYVALYHKGLALSKLSQYEAAITTYDRASAIKLDLHEALYNKGVILEKIGRYESAITAYSKAIIIKPDKQEALCNKGNSLDKLGRHRAAITIYDQALQIRPDDYEVIHNKGNSLYKLGQYRSAIATYDQALQINPDCDAALCNKGLAFANLGRYESAIATYDQALKISPDCHKTWLNRGIAASKAVNTSLPIHSSFASQHPMLTKRGYVGEKASYAVGLGYVKASHNPEGWGRLHHEMGNAHYLHGRFLHDATVFLNKAAKSYEKALTTLNAFPALHLDVLSDAIRTHLGLRNTDTVKKYQEQGSAVFLQLINNAPTSAQKQQLEQKFSGFSQLQVDTLIQETSHVAALKTAEYQKNRTLNWILDNWQEQITSPSWAEMRTLLTLDTAAVYWHLSPDTLTTFLLTADATEPQVISVASAEALKTWIKSWQQVYQTYRKKGKSVDEVADRDRPNHPWRLSLDAELKNLRDILDIDQIEAALSQQTHLLLVPHRQLHQLPLHALFTQPFITTYLPSLQTGLTLKQKQSNQLKANSLPALLLETPENDELEPLVFAEVETALVAYLCQQQGQTSTLVSSEQAHNPSVTTTLNRTHRFFHFTGHGAHDYRHPKNSALALTGTDTLTANEIAKLPLDTYDLVTLAACETAVAGQANLDTDYVSLASAFLAAGATQVISTLWTVDSESNAWLMVKFYQRYLTGTPVPVALHQAQQWLRTVTYTQLADWLESLNTNTFSQSCQNGEDETLTDTIGKHRVAARKLQTSQMPYANPYYWAAFTLTGYCHEGQ